MEGNETESETALREIREETGLTVTLDTCFRAVVTYSPKPGVMKDVIYFAAEYIGGEAHRQVEEVTEICWVPAEEAAAHITFENDKDVLGSTENIAKHNKKSVQTFICTLFSYAHVALSEIT